ncbi:MULTISPECIES: hypothetical protein [Ruegeria]|nr:MULTISPECIES: hypothetical protein [Ruegeria]
MNQTLIAEFVPELGNDCNVDGYESQAICVEGDFAGQLLAVESAV